MTRRWAWRGVLAVILALAALAAGLDGTLASRALAAVQPPMCGAFDGRPVVSRGSLFEILTDSFKGQPECVATGPGLAFSVVSSSIVRGPAGNVQAYPHLVDESWRAVKVAALPGSLAVTWTTRLHAPGLWNASIDMWVTRGLADKPADIRAEVMVWISNTVRYRYTGRPVVRVDGTRWYVVTWGGRPGVRRYVQFRREHPVNHVRLLRLAPFFRAARALGYVKRRWRVQSLEAGFELWQGGAGLAMEKFRVVP